jgi:ABC-type Fe3+ transport system substrate-binding protein
MLKAAGISSLATGVAMTAPAKPHDFSGVSHEESCPPAPLETRTIAQLYEAAIQEGGNLVVVEGGDATNQESAVVAAFQSQFPKINLSMTVDLSKYNDARVDLDFDKQETPPDVIHLQTLQDFPRWKSEGHLLNYKPLGWERVYQQFKDPDGAWTALGCILFTNVVNTSIPASEAPRNFLDYLDPKYKSKLVFTYPNDDDAVLFIFYTAIQEHGWSYMDKLMENDPLFVRGAYRVSDTVGSGVRLATFSSSGPLFSYPGVPIQMFLRTSDKFVAWGQRAVIFKAAAHPNAAKLWTSWNLLPATQAITSSFSVRDDVAPPTGFQPIVDYKNASLAEFPAFMEDRAAAERFRAIMQLYVGDPTGPDPGTTYTSPSIT